MRRIRHFGRDTHGLHYTDFENNEARAHSLQEEEYFNIFADNNWFGTSRLIHSNYGHHKDMRAAYDPRQRRTECVTEIKIHCLCSPLGKNLLSNVEDLLRSLEVTIEPVTDSEVIQRLNRQMANHVPRTNRRFLSAGEEISDHQRLLDRLKLYNLVEHKVKGDGNCQFRSISDQLYDNPELHMYVRKQVIEQLRSQQELYENYVPMSYLDYLEKMSKAGEWGDHVTLQAAADRFGVRILLITSFKDTCCIEILPRVQKSRRLLLLSYWDETHYNSVYPATDLPLSGKEKDKKWWKF